MRNIQSTKGKSIAIGYCDLTNDSGDFGDSYDFYSYAYIQLFEQNHRCFYQLYSPIWYLPWDYGAYYQVYYNDYLVYFYGDCRADSYASGHVVPLA